MYYKDNLAVNVLLKLNIDGYSGIIPLSQMKKAERMTKNSMTVGDWKSKFKTQYPGYDVVVYKNNGEKASGQTKLATVRDTYLDDQN